MTLKFFLPLFTCILLFANCVKPVNKKGIAINSKSYSNYGELLGGIDSLLCNKIKFDFIINEKDTILINNHCSTSNTIRCGTPLSFSFSKKSAVSFNQSDNQLEAKMENYILNPSRRADMAQNPNQAVFLVAIEKNITTSEVFKQLNRMNYLYKQIKTRNQLTNNMVINFMRENFIPASLNEIN